MQQGEMPAGARQADIFRPLEFIPVFQTVNLMRTVPGAKVRLSIKALTKIVHIYKR